MWSETSIMYAVGVAQRVVLAGVVATPETGCLGLKSATDSSLIGSRLFSLLVFIMETPKPYQYAFAQ